MARPRLLIVSYIFPPQLLARSLQLMKTVNALVKLGWDVTVYTADPARIREPLDPCLMAKVSPEIRIIPGYTLESWLFANATASLHLGMPDDKYVWRWAGKKALKKLLVNERFDVMASFGLQWSSHLLALEIKKAESIPWLAHFSDPWVGNTYVPRPWPVSAINARQEREVCLNADSLCFTTAATKDFVTQKYGPEIEAKGLFVPHCYSRELYPETGVRHDDNTLNLTHVGCLYALCKPDNFLLALSSFLEKEPRFKSRIKVRFVGVSGRKHADHAKSLGLLDCISFIPKVPYLKSLEYMREADVLFSIDVVKKSMLSKLPDYIGAGRPLFAISAPTSPTAGYVSRLHGLVARENDPNDIEEKLATLLHSWEKDKTLGEFSYTKEEAAPFDSLNTTKILSDELSRLASL